MSKSKNSNYLSSTKRKDKINKKQLKSKLRNNKKNLGKKGKKSIKNIKGGAMFGDDLNATQLVSYVYNINFKVMKNELHISDVIEDIFEKLGFPFEKYRQSIKSINISIPLFEFETDTETDTYTDTDYAELKRIALVKIQTLLVKYMNLNYVSLIKLSLDYRPIEIEKPISISMLENPFIMEFTSQLFREIKNSRITELSLPSDKLTPNYLILLSTDLLNGNQTLKKLNLRNFSIWGETSIIHPSEENKQKIITFFGDLTNTKLHTLDLSDNRLFLDNPIVTEILEALSNSKLQLEELILDDWQAQYKSSNGEYNPALLKSLKHLLFDCKSLKKIKIGQVIEANLLLKFFDEYYSTKRLGDSITPIKKELNLTFDNIDIQTIYVFALLEACYGLHIPIRIFTGRRPENIYLPYENIRKKMIEEQEKRKSNFSGDISKIFGVEMSAIPTIHMACMLPSNIKKITIEDILSVCGFPKDIYRIIKERIGNLSLEIVDILMNGFKEKEDYDRIMARVGSSLTSEDKKTIYKHIGFLDGDNNTTLSKKLTPSPSVSRRSTTCPGSRCSILG
jgi:hypothetical protein